MTKLNEMLTKRYRKRYRMDYTHNDCRMCDIYDRQKPEGWHCECIKFKPEECRSWTQIQEVGPMAPFLLFLLFLILTLILIYFLML